MEFYEVGGCVRDQLLGRPVRDRDWVVVGATPEALLALGFRPVGKDFPVFLHPQTHEEYALARTERKTAPGYAGFVFHAAPDVTLEEDLARRDLTINAMARDAHGQLIDPFGGRNDLQARLLRHVGPHFVEDPVRILRIARFAARFDDFEVAPETRALLREMVESGEADALVAERVWRELAAGLMEARPSRMLAVLADCGLAAPLFDGLHHPVANAPHLDRAAGVGLKLEQRFALLAGGSTPDGFASFLAREKVRLDSRSAELSRLMVEFGAALGTEAAAKPDRMLELLEQTDALRRPARFEELLQAVEIVHPPLPRFRIGLAAARAVDAGAIAAANASDPPAIRAALHRARLAAIATALAPGEL
jgi:tRNA nucleotidyltransferase (CCA-adding enzyme)